MAASSVPAVPGSSTPIRRDALDLAERHFLRRLLLQGFLIRAALAIVLDLTGFSQGLAPDELTYASGGWDIALYWSGRLLMEPWRLASGQPLGYFYLNALFYTVFGQTDVPIKLANAFIGAWSVRYAYLLARELFGASVARRAAILTTFFPSLVLWSVLNIRDVWVIFLILYVSWKSLAIVRGYSPLALFQILAGVYALTLFRDYLFWVVAIPPTVAILVGRGGRVERNFLLASSVGLCLLVLVQLGFVGGRAHSMSLETLSQARQNLAIGGSAFAEGADISTPTKALSYLPIGLAYFFFAPFPWQITSFLKALTVPEMLMVYGWTPAAIRGIRYAIRQRLRDCLQVLLLTGLLTVSYALGEGNAGTLYRHRAQAIVFYIVFASVGVELKRTQAATLSPTEGRQLTR